MDFFECFFGNSPDQLDNLVRIIFETLLTDLGIETLSGTVNGVNNTFTSVATMPDYALILTKNGDTIAKQDRTISGTTVTLVTPPTVGSVVYAIWA